MVKMLLLPWNWSNAWFFETAENRQKGWNIMNFPKMALLKQNFEIGPAVNIEERILQESNRTGLLTAIKRGDNVLITAGSRGIGCMPDVLKSLVAAIKQAGGRPMIFPAMGSHGRGEAQSQVNVLKHLGITESCMNCPVYDKLEMVQIGTVMDDCPVYVDKVVQEADHILLVNRIKEHTEYIGDTESGLLKMTVVGLGRQIGAEKMHRLAVNISYQKAIHAIAAKIFEKTHMLGGVAILENQLNRLQKIEVVPADDIFEREPVLLKESQQYKAKLPFDDIDVLVVDEIGKEVSGSGMDTKVIGRIMNVYEKECEKPKIMRIIVRDLSETTDGNALGIGLADYTTRRVVDQIDFQALNLNCITASAPEKARIPITLPDDKAVLEAALRTIGQWTPEQVKIVWIHNTASLQWMAVSESLAVLADKNKNIDVHGPLFDLSFDSGQNLLGIRKILRERKYIQ